MIRTFRIVAGAAAIAVSAVLALPANAQYASEFTPAKLLKQGTTSKAIAGSGTVVVQVQVNANGSHKVVRIIRSTNVKDNAAAIDIANSSTYRPAHRGTKSVMAYYDFTLKFKGSSVASNGVSVAKGSAAARVDGMIHQGKYAAAKAAAQEALESHPSDPLLNQELGTAEYFLADYGAAAAAFDKVPQVSKTFSQVAAQSFAMAAVKASAPQQAVAYAKKAVALTPSANTYYALGTAELQANDASAASADLKKAYDMVQSDPKADTKTKVAIASQLYQAYDTAGDHANAQKMLATIKQMDPNNTAVGTLQGNQYLRAGNDAAKSGDHAGALKDFEQAADVGSNQVKVTAYAAAALQQSALLSAQKTPATKDDYAKVAAYADKALAISPNDALANYAKGVGLAGEWVVSGKKDSGLKQQALDALNKAKAAAQSAGNISLSISIDNFVKSTLQ